MKDGQKKYVLTLSEDQARCLSFASELVSRLDMGQLDCLRDFTRYPNDNLDEIYRKLDELRELMGLIPSGCGRNAYWGISSPEIKDRARTLFDIYQVIRHQLWKDDPGAPNHIVSASPAFQTDHSQCLPEISGT